MGNNSKVKYQEHYKLIIPFKDDIIFETELMNQNIDYFKDEKSIVNFRYFFLNNDKVNIDLILRKKEIIASIETLPIHEYKEEKKIQKFYLKIVIIVLIILFFIELLNS